MPRGVYDRSKSKDKAVPVAKKAAPVAKAAAPVKAKTKTVVAKASPSPAKAERPETGSTLVDVQIGFQLLGQSLDVLSEVLTRTQETSVRGAVEAELAATLASFSALREQTFGSLIAKEEPVEASEEETHPLTTSDAPNAAPSLPVASAPHLPAPGMLPQGNASFTPPAPPAPQH